MNKNKLPVAFLIGILFILSFPVTAYANSSWHWVTTTCPFDLLPFAIILTLLIEVLSVNFIARIRDLKRVIPVVCLANLVSFLLPYLWLGINPDNAYANFGNSIFFVIGHTVRSMPAFTVSVFFLFITLFAEMPVVYFLLRKKAENENRLIAVIFVANVVTTLLTFAVERIFCYGEW